MKLLITLITALSSGLFAFGQTFSPQNSGVSSQLNGIDFSSPSVGMVVGNGGVIRKTMDAGLHWTSSNSGTQYDLNGIAYLNGSTYVAVGENGTILKTTNAGASWTTVNSGTSNDLTGIFVNGLNIYVTGANGTILVSTNSGNAWTPINTGISFKLNKIFFVSDLVGYAVGDGGTILKTVNAGQAWNFQASGTNTHSLTDIYFTDANTGVVVGGIAGSNEAIILRTTNAGSVWTSDDITGVILSGVAFYPDNSVGYAVGGSYSGNTSIIYKTTGQGASWLPVVSSSSRQLAVCFPGNGIGYTCGLNGTILRFASNTLELTENDEADIQISPNPGTGMFYVSAELTGDFSIEVLSANGQCIAVIENGNSIDLTASPQGIYVAVIRSGSSVVTKKLVKE
ncbi:YCF48-related protein [uncultured Fluviicola sp.]|uniref:YCF48-related protein n=1 Tax=uncultured Fluviicola sp. TaxID=463303 RepID=UPI0025E90440|nr:YCF48-related protein [uncultured Fluviicola sp.]